MSRKGGRRGGSREKLTLGERARPRRRSEGTEEELRETAEVQ